MEHLDAVCGVVSLHSRYRAYAVKGVVLQRVTPGDTCPPTQRHVEDNYPIDLRMALPFSRTGIEYRGMDTWRVLQHICCLIYIWTFRQTQLMEEPN